jgi:hypothetical protein
VQDKDLVGFYCVNQSFYGMNKIERSLVFLRARERRLMSGEYLINPPHVYDIYPDIPCFAACQKRFTRRFPTGGTERCGSGGAAICQTISLMACLAMEW